MRAAITCVVVAGFTATAALGGVYFGSDSGVVDVFVVVHPPGYTGAGGNLEVRVCSAAETTAATLSAIDLWNAFARTTQNCTDCFLIEEASPPEEPRSMDATLLHELGHCAMGIDHINWIDEDQTTSYTNAVDVGLYTDGADGVRGSSDDGVAPAAGARLIHWFRTADNDPFVIDATVIDSATYTRRRIDLPSGHNWSASGNRGVGDLLGLMDTQSVMYSIIDPPTRYHGLTADDINTVEFAMSGLDETAATADDYTITLIHVSDCANAEIEVLFAPLGVDGALGFCDANLVSLAPPKELDVHHALVKFPSQDRIEITINSDKEWDFTVFEDGFEDGTTDAWDITVP